MATQAVLYELQYAIVFLETNVIGPIKNTLTTSNSETSTQYTHVREAINLYRLST